VKKKKQVTTDRGKAIFKTRNRNRVQEEKIRKVSSGPTESKTSERKGKDTKTRQHQKASTISMARVFHRILMQDVRNAAGFRQLGCLSGEKTITSEKMSTLKLQTRKNRGRNKRKLTSSSKGVNARTI